MKSFFPKKQDTQVGKVDKTPMFDPPKDPTSTSHKKQWQLLERVSTGPRAKQFPQLAQLFNGDRSQKLEALKLYVDNEENLERAETAFTVSKTHTERVSHKRRWLTIKQMRDDGCSENLGKKFFVHVIYFLN